VLLYFLDSLHRVTHFVTVTPTVALQRFIALKCVVMI